MKNYLFIIFFFFGLHQCFSQNEEKYYEIFLKNINDKFYVKPHLIKEKNVAIKLINYISTKIASENKLNIQPYSDAIQFLETGNIDKAIQVLNDSVIRKKGDFRNYLLKARLSIINLNFLNADDYYERIVSSPKPLIDIVYEYALVCEYQNMFSIAKPLYEEALGAANTDIEEGKIYTRLAYLYHRQNQNQIAIDYSIKAYSVFCSYVKSKNTTINPLLADLYHTQAKINRALNYFDKSKDNYTQAIKIFETLALKQPSNFKLKLAEVYMEIAKLYSDLKQETEALDYYQKALKIREEVSEKYPTVYKALVAETYNHIGISYRNKGQLKSAAEVITKAISNYQQTSKYSDEYLYRIADLQNNLAVIYSELNLIEDALKAFKLSSESYSKLAQNNNIFEIGIANVQINLGALYKDTKQYSNAQDAYIKALGIYTAFANIDADRYLPDVALTYQNLAVLFDETNQNSKAIEYYNKALEIRKKFAEKRPEIYQTLVADGYHSMGNVYTKKGQNDSALITYQNAVQIYQNYRTSDLCLGTLFSNMGNVYKNMKIYDKSEDYLKKSLNMTELCSKQNDIYLPEMAQAYINLGMLYFEINKLDSATIALHKALDIQKKYFQKDSVLSKPKLIAIYNHLGKIYSTSNQPDKALEYFNKAVICSEYLLNSNPFYAEELIFSLSNLSNFYVKNKKYTEAVKVTERLVNMYDSLACKSPEIYSKYLADNQSNLSLIYSAIRKDSKAIEFAEKALKNYQFLAQANHDKYEPDIAMCYNSMGNIYSDMNLNDKAIDAYERALKMRKDLASRNKMYLVNVADSYNNLGTLLFNIMLYEKAIENFTQALNIYSSSEISNNNDIKSAIVLINISKVYQNLLKTTPKKEYKDLGLKNIHACLEILQKIPQNPKAQIYMEQAIQLKGFFNTFVTE